MSAPYREAWTKVTAAHDLADAIEETPNAVTAAEAMWRAFSHHIGCHGSSSEFRFTTADGSLRSVDNRYVPVRDTDGRLVEVEGIVIHITERKAADEKIAQLACTDNLTGLANRATFHERLHQSFAAAQRGALPFAALYLDLDFRFPIS